MDANRKVFLCHSSQEKPIVEKIRNFLHSQQNIKTFMDKYDLVPFARWELQLQEELDNCKFAAIFLGRSGLGAFQEKEIKKFKELSREKDDFQFGLVILPGCSEDVLSKARSKWKFLTERQWINFYQSEPDPILQLVRGITSCDFIDDCYASVSNTDLSVVKQNKELRVELFKLVADELKSEAESLYRDISLVEAEIREIDRNRSRLAFELVKELDPELQKAVKLFEGRIEEIALQASKIALKDSQELDREKTDWFRIEIENYLKRVHISLIAKDTDLLYEKMERNSGCSSDDYLKALEWIKRRIHDFDFDANVYGKIEECLNLLIKIV